MNCLSLRISTGAKKSKNLVSLPPVVITNFPADISKTENELVKTFLQAATCDEQLAVLKKNLDKEDLIDTDIMKFLVVVFFHSEAKHPVKCFLARRITKSKHLQEPFIELLTVEITSHLSSWDNDYKNYKNTVPKIVMCMENFPAATRAIENVAVLLLKYLKNSLECCIMYIRQLPTPSPTDKNAIYSLVHLTLRLLLHILTKIEREDEDMQHWIYYYINECLVILLYDKDVPMDTKSMCGLVALSLVPYILDYKPSKSSDHSEWKFFMMSQKWDEMPDEVKLAKYSAITTIVPIQQLQEKLIYSDKGPLPIVVIVQKLTDIVERSSSDGVLILGVTRTLHHISKFLSKLQLDLGLQIADRLLEFVWVHLEHYMDSVRHLAAQMLANVIQYCAYVEVKEDAAAPLALEKALARLGALGVTRRGFHLGLRGCARALPAARVLRDVAPLPRLLPALQRPEISTTAAGTLHDLLERHSLETEASVIHELWVLPILHFVQTEDLEPEVLTILEKLLVKAVKLNQNLVTFILPHIKQACESPERDYRNVVVLLSLARSSIVGLAGDPASDPQDRWGGFLSYDAFEDAVIDAREEVRLGALALVCGGAGRGAGATRGEMSAARRYLAYSGDEQASHARLRALALFNKLIKRVLDGLRAAKRSGDEEKSQMYREFFEQLRQQCYSNLQPGGNYSRRFTALQLLKTCESAALPYQRIWKPDYVDKLLLHLDDSYEINKALALDILQQVPLELLKDTKHSVSLQLDDIIKQANALKPTECVSAAYKLELLWRCLPDNILQGKPCVAAEPVLYGAVSQLMSVHPAYNFMLAPRDCPMYGVLHCIAHLLDRTDPDAIADCSEWRNLLYRLIHLCRVILNDSSIVVNHAAPEGVMPPDCQYSDYGNNAGVMLEDGRQVTAQMVLLCAWRTVKEATSVLGAIGSRFRTSTVIPQRLGEVADILSEVVGRARHRGAFEQAYVAYERVLHRMWRDTNDRVSVWPQDRLRSTLTWLRADAGAGGGMLGTASRRSAGLPFLIQGLVSTEVNAGGPGTGLRDVMTELLRLAEAGAGAEAEAGTGAEAKAEAVANSRAHAFNMLRALYRDSSLDMAVQSYVGEGLRVALKGFECATWAERNSSTLLLSALMTRVFGVSRTRAVLSARNRMTGRVFYLRYPQLYDIMLNKLKEVSESDDKQLLCPSLYPVLLILARLYPSSLEGTESNLKLVSFVPYVVECARSRVLYTRRLAAAAGVALISPDRYVQHLEYLLGLVSNARVEMNFCHGILLQLCALLDNKPEGVECSGIAELLPGTLWLLAQPCHPVMQQLAQLLSTLATRFPETLREEIVEVIETRLREVVFTSKAKAAACGREMCLAACLRLLLLLHRRRHASVDIADVLLSALQHDVHAVCDAALDYILSLYSRPRVEVEVEVKAEVEVGAEAEVGTEHEIARPDLKTSAEAEAVLSALRARDVYIPRVAFALRDQSIWKYDPQRALKHLEILVAEGDTHELIVELTWPLDQWIFGKRSRLDGVVIQLQKLLTLGPINAMHLYLESLISYAMPRLQMISMWEVKLVAECIRICCCNEMPQAVRALAALELHATASALLEHAIIPADDKHGHFSLEKDVESNVFVSVAELLHDTEPGVRALAARTALTLAGQRPRSVVPSHAGALLLDACTRHARGTYLLVALALCGSPNRPHLTDPNIPDECRVFEPSEKENVHGENLLWAAACADKFVELCARQEIDPLTHFSTDLKNKNWPAYSLQFREAYKLAAGKDAVAAPTTRLFIQKLRVNSKM